MQGTHRAICPAASVSSLRIATGDGDDTVRVGVPVPAVIEGGSGNDKIRGRIGNDVIDGDDRIWGGGGDDVLFGGPGDQPDLGGATV